MKKQDHRMEVKVDPEFERIIPPLTDEEFEQLRNNVLEIGEILEPICVWNGIIVDGHNRWKIIQENPDILYRVHEMGFADRLEAKEWMCRNQLGRRNLTTEQRQRLIGQMQETRKKLVGGQAGNSNAEKRLGQNEPIVSTPRSTAEAIANEVGVSEATVKRAEKFSKGIDALGEVSKEAADKVLRGGSGVTQATIIQFPKMRHEEKAKVAKSIIEGRPINHKQNKVVELYDSSSAPKYTSQDLAEEIRVNAETWVRTLRNIVADRATLLTDETRPEIAKAIKECVVDPIMSIMRNVSDENDAEISADHHTTEQSGHDAHSAKPKKATGDKTAGRVGKESGVNAKTIRRDADYAAAVDKIDSVSPGFKDFILSGSIKVPKKLLKGVCDLQNGLIQEALEAIKAGDIQDAENLIYVGKSIRKQNSDLRMKNSKDVEFEPVT